MPDNDPGPLEPHSGVLTIVIGALSLVMCPFVLGPMGCVTAWTDLKGMREGRTDPRGKPLVLTGLVLSVLGCLVALGVGYYILTTKMKRA